MAQIVLGLSHRSRTSFWLYLTATARYRFPFRFLPPRRHMRTRALAICLLLVGVSAAQGKSPHQQPVKPETHHLDFVKEYVRELISDETLKTKGENEYSEDK